MATNRGGRPRRAERLRAISIRLPADLIDAIDRRAEAMSDEIVGRRSAVVREALRAVFAREGK